MLFHPELLNAVAAQQMADKRHEAEMTHLVQMIKRENNRLSKPSLAGLLSHIFANLR